MCAPLATRLSVRYGKRELSAFSCLFGAVILFLCMVIYPKNEWVYVGFFVLAYIGIGFFNTVIWAMITDVIDDARLRAAHGPLPRQKLPKPSNHTEY